MIPLILAPKNKDLTVDKINGGKNINTRLTELGLIKGKTIQVINKANSGPVLVQIDNARIAIGQGMAMKVMVRV